MNKEIMRWQPIFGQFYFYLNDEGIVRCVEWYYEDEDLFRYNSGNCFKTEQEAIEHKENLITSQVLKDTIKNSDCNYRIKFDGFDEVENKYHFTITLYN